MRITVLASPLLLALASCVATPMTHPDLPGQTAAEFVCSQLPPAEAKSRLQKAWNKCYIGPELQSMAVMAGKVPIIVPVGSDGTTQVLAEGPEDAGSLSVQLPGGKRVLYARFFSSKSCPTLIAVDSGPVLWISAAKNTKAWIEDPNASGPVGNCL